jgi:ABC-type multidrug transport system fused ATPase/permease subunit
MIIERLAHGRTVIRIAQRLNTLRDAVAILVPDHGKVAEKRTLDELLALNRACASLHASQIGADLTWTVR